MANPQLEDGYTMVANEILEALSRIRIAGQAWQVLCVIIRKTYGFKKKTDYISLSQFKKSTKMDRPHICRAIKKLILMNIIIKKDKQNKPSYRFNKDFDTWKPLSKKTRGGNLDYQKGKFGLSKKTHTKETITKERRKEVSRETANLKNPVIKKRTPAQKWQDGQFDLISKKYQKLWKNEPDIKDMVVWLQWADKSVGLVIVGLQRANAYEIKSKGIIESITAWLRSDFKKRNYWTDTELAEIKKIDNDYRENFKAKTNIIVMGKIMEGMRNVTLTE